MSYKDNDQGIRATKLCPAKPKHERCRGYPINKLNQFNIIHRNILFSSVSLLFLAHEQRKHGGDNDDCDRHHQNGERGVWKQSRLKQS